ncbi:MAG: PqqD family protein [Desulfuromonadaceae bacterium]
MTLALTSTVIRTEGVMTAPVDHEIVILNMASNNYISLDAIGRRIWELLATEQTVTDACRKLSLEFDATEEQIAADLIPFLTELEKDGLVRVLS